MKKFFTFLLIVCVSILGIQVFTVSAYAAEDDYFVYKEEIDENTERIEIHKNTKLRTLSLNDNDTNLIDEYLLNSDLSFSFSFYGVGVSISGSHTKYEARPLTLFK